MSEEKSVREGNQLGFTSKPFGEAFYGKGLASLIRPETGPNNIETGSDNVDQCLFCGSEIPPGPDFCGSVCEIRAKHRAERDSCPCIWCRE